MNIAVCDDLKEALLDTKNVLEQIPYVKKIDLYSDIEFLFDEIQEGTHYDAVLMDIDWKKDRTGIDFAADLQKYSPYTKIIYVTAYTLDYVEDVFLKSSNISGFLMKPVRLERLEKNLEKILREREDTEGKLVVKHKGSIKAIPFRDIVYLESKLHKVNIYVKDRIYECTERLDMINERLDKQFLRCHKSYIVNMHHIREIQGMEIILENNIVIPISKVRHSNVKSGFFEYMSTRL